MATKKTRKPRADDCVIPTRPKPEFLRASLVESSPREEADIASYFESIFPGARRQIAEIRIWRRGHNWYIPVPRMMSEIQPLASRPLGRIFFANADSLGAISEFGWALAAADKAVRSVEKTLG